LSGAADKPWVIRDRIHGDVLLRDQQREKLALALLDTPLLQRTRRIGMAGSEALKWPGLTASRFEHTLGTLWLADQQVAEFAGRGLRGHEDSWELATLLSLLHHVFYPPCSHDLLAPFRGALGNDGWRDLVRSCVTAALDQAQDVAGTRRRYGREVEERLRRWAGAQPLERLLNALTARCDLTSDEDPDLGELAVFAVPWGANCLDAFGRYAYQMPWALGLNPNHLRLGFATLLTSETPSQGFGTEHEVALKAACSATETMAELLYRDPTTLLVKAARARIAAAMWCEDGRQLSVETPESLRLPRVCSDAFLRLDDLAFIHFLSTLRGDSRANGNGTGSVVHRLSGLALDGPGAWDKPITTAHLQFAGEPVRPGDRLWTVLDADTWLADSVADALDVERTTILVSRPPALTLHLVNGLFSVLRILQDGPDLRGLMAELDRVRGHFSAGPFVRAWYIGQKKLKETDLRSAMENAVANIGERGER